LAGSEPPLGPGLDRAGRIGAARRLGDREERLVALAQRGHRVLLDLRLAAGPDRGRRVAAEDAAARVVEPHAVLRHRLENNAHTKSIEPAAPVLLAGAEGPQPGRLGLGGEADEILARDLGRVGIDGLLERNDLFLDKPSDLVAEQAQLLREREAGEHRHGGVAPREP